MLTRIIAVLAVILMIGSVFAQNNSLSLKNNAVEVAFDAAAGRFTLTAMPSKRVFVTEGRLSPERGTAKLAPVSHPTFGDGQSIDVTYSNGNRDAIMLFPTLPFVLFRATRHNGASEPALIRQQSAPTLAVDLNKPAKELKTLGTGGLLAPDQNPGSYMWLAIADPISRRGVVGGWLTCNRGSGVLFSQVNDEQVRLAGQIDYGRLRLAPGKSEVLEILAVGYFDDARLGLEAWADAIAKVNRIHLPPQPVGYCTWYSRPHGGASDAIHLAEQAEFAATNLAPYGFSVIQIDDGWQAGVSTNGPKRNFTTHAAKGPYPNGMKAAADRIKSLGMVPGLWFMPFAGTYYDPFFQDHQDWFVKHEDGSPYETAWGGTSLDMTHPGVREYLRNNIQRIAEEWGFQYFKMDGLWTGTATRQQYVNDAYKADGMGDAVFADPDKTNLEAYRDGLKLVRQTAGDRIFILGCCSPQNMRSYGGAFGLVDAMRIGPDNGSDWRGLLRGPTYGSRQYFLHGRVWYNDPDPVYVRTNMPLSQAQLICSWVTLSGQLNLSSEWLPSLPAERLEILKRTMPSHGLLPRPVDLLEEKLPRLWLLTDTRHSPRRDVLGLFNWDNHEYDFDYPLERLGLSASTGWVAYDYWQNQLIPFIKGRLRLMVPAQTCRVLALRPVSNRPQLISTSRHITQGIVDVLEETWDNAASVLRGRSKVVGSDPYELRVVATASDKDWSVVTVEVSPADQAAGVKVIYNEQDGLVRAVIASLASREVAWTIKFKSSLKQE